MTSPPRTCYGLQLVGSTTDIKLPEPPPLIQAPKPHAPPNPLSMLSASVLATLQANASSGPHRYVPFSPSCSPVNYEDPRSTSDAERGTQDTSIEPTGTGTPQFLVHAYSPTPTSSFGASSPQHQPPRADLSAVPQDIPPTTPLQPHPPQDRPNRVSCRRRLQALTIRSLTNQSATETQPTTSLHSRREEMMREIQRAAREEATRKG